MIVVVDYGLGNLGSIHNMLKKLGVESRVTDDTDEVLHASKLILPGVGAFDHGMTNLRERGLVELLHRKVLQDDTPILGICLGMQLMTRGSEEGQLPGLGWLPATTRRFRPSSPDLHLPVPHMGWNYVEPSATSALFAGLPDDPRFYFVHSFYVDADEDEYVSGRTTYDVSFVSAVERNNVLGVQFHPEKSHKFGMALLRNFADSF
jgi:imidazole glycerol-phosphate synthase subunit HisH